MKIEFKQLLPNFYKLIEMALLAETSELSDACWSALDNFLKSAGWLNQEFDLALIDYIDQNWQIEVN